MDTEPQFSIFLSVLVVAALLLSFSSGGVSVSNSSSQESSLCEKAQITSSVITQPVGVTQGDDTNPSQGATTISNSCSISLQVIPVKNQKLVLPSARSLKFPPFTSAISSQVFVFQEPDPPQTT